MSFASLWKEAVQKGSELAEQAQKTASQVAVQAQKKGSQLAEQAQAKGQQLIQENKIIRDAVETASQTADRIADGYKKLNDSVSEILVLKLHALLKDVDFQASIVALEKVRKEKNINVSPLVDILQKMDEWTKGGKK